MTDYGSQLLVIYLFLEEISCVSETLGRLKIKLEDV